MTTLIEFRNSQGVIGRCDAKTASYSVTKSSEGG